MALTLSVFLPACGATKVDDCLSERDVCELLDASDSKDLFGDLIRKIRYSKKSPSEVRPISTQTEGSGQIGLDERLAMIDHAYAQPLRHQTVSNHQLESIQKRVGNGISEIRIILSVFRNSFPSRFRKRLKTKFRAQTRRKTRNIWNRKRV